MACDDVSHLASVAEQLLAHRSIERPRTGLGLAHGDIELITRGAYQTLKGRQRWLARPRFVRAHDALGHARAPAQLHLGQPRPAAGPTDQRTRREGRHARIIADRRWMVGELTAKKSC